MAKFKKLAFLCMALVMTAGFATATACGSGTENNSSSSSVEESSEPSSEDGGEDDGGEDDGGEDDGGDGGNENQGPEMVNKTINIDEATTFDIAANTYIFVQLMGTGEFILTWDNANVIVKKGSSDVAGGTAIASGDTVKVDDTRDLEAGITLSTANFSAAKVTLTVTKKVAPPQALALNENQVETSGEGREATFTATKAGTYILSAASNETNAVVSVKTESGSDVIELPYEFTVEANATITFGVSTQDKLADTINLVLAEKPLEATTFTLAKGDNSIPVTVPEAGVIATFTAETAGKYRVKYTDSNILVRKADGTTEVVSNSEFELKAGESFVLKIFTADGKAGTVTLIVEKYVSEDGSWTKNY